MRFISFIAILLFPVVASAGISLGKNVYEVSDLEKARAEALAKGQPITFLYTDKESTCPLCNEATERILKELGRDTVMVYVKKTTDVPLQVRNLLHSKGKFIPKAAVFDSGLQNSLGLVIYEDIKKDGHRAFTQIDEAIKQAEEDTRTARRLMAAGERAERSGKLGQALDTYQEAKALGYSPAGEKIGKLEAFRAAGFEMAGKFRKEKNYYDAVLTLEKLVAKFGPEHASKAVEQLADMKAEETIRKEVGAEIIYRKAKAKKDKSMLQQILDDFPETAAAEKAKAVLNH